MIGFYKTQLNFSFSKFEIRIHNTGNEPLEEYKVFLNFDGEIQNLSDTNEEGHNIARLLSKYKSNTYLWEDTMTGKIIPNNTILVGGDTLSSEDIFLKPFPKEYDVKIEWKLISKDFKDNGELILKIRPDIVLESKEVLIEDPTKLGIIEGEIEDYFEGDE
jgi:hypothetical protein